MGRNLDWNKTAIIMDIYIYMYIYIYIYVYKLKSNMKL